MGATGVAEAGLRPMVTPATKVEIGALGERIIGSAGRLAAATYQWLLLVAEFDVREGAALWGFPSTTRWLMHYCGLARRTAAEHVRVALALRQHPSLGEAMARGRLSFSQVRAISRVTDIAEPALIEALIMTAEHGTVEQLEFAVRGLRTVDDTERNTREPRERLVQRWGDDSQWRCSARLEPERGAVIDAALSAVVEREGIDRPAALVRLAEIALAVMADADGHLPTLRGDEAAAVVVHLHTRLDGVEVEDEPRSAERAGTPETREQPLRSTPCRETPRSAERDRPAVAPGSTGIQAHLLRGPGLPDRVLRRLLCQCRVRIVVRDQDGNPLDLGRSSRLVSRKQFAALLLRDGGCAHPGCGRRTTLQAHHVRHWLDGGPTNIANLVLLCEAHHHAHHDGEFAILTAGRGRFRFLRADGLPLHRPAEPVLLGDDPPPDDAAYDHVDPDAATTRWDGRRLDRHYAIAVLAQGLRTPATPPAQPRAA